MTMPPQGETSALAKRGFSMIIAGQGAQRSAPGSDLAMTIQIFSNFGESMVVSKDDPELVAMRRHLHRYPELSMKEERTAQYIEEKLRAFGIETIERLADTGVVALIEGEKEGITKAYRADIDALPIQEVSEVVYKSTNPGVMHACGHDVHTTVGLGCAREVYRRRRELKGRVKFIFQPAEEASPENEPIGAERMVQEGVLKNPDVEAIFALHCMPALEVGKIGYTGGPVWAASELVEIEVEGKKSHGAYPHEGIDAVAVAAQLIVSLQQVVSRMVDTRQPCVLTVGRMEAGNSYNITAEKAEMTGILRGLSEEGMQTARRAIEKMVASLPGAFGATGRVRFTPGARLTANDVELEARTVELIRQKVGKELVVQHLPQLGAEDFSAFSRRVPGCYLFLGIRNEARGIVYPLHTPTFDVDEECLSIGVKAMTEVLLGI